MSWKVIIRGDKGYKFVVLKTDDGDVVVFADDNSRIIAHSDLVKQYCRENGVLVQCLGGGEMRIDRNAKIMRVWGISGYYGLEPDRDRTIRMIQATFPDFVVVRDRPLHY